MRMEKKLTLKEDGRYLVYYHFPDTATPEETQAFEAVRASDASATVTTDATETAISVQSSETQQATGSTVSEGIKRV